MKKQAYLIWTYTFFLCVGGIIGFFKAGSAISLIMASLFTILLTGCGYGVWNRNKLAYNSAIGLLSMLFIFFGYRFLMTYQAMPAGIMTLLTSLVLAPLMADKKQLLEIEG